MRATYKLGTGRDQPRVLVECGPRVRTFFVPDIAQILSTGLPGDLG